MQNRLPSINVASGGGVIFHTQFSSAGGVTFDSEPFTRESRNWHQGGGLLA